MKNEAGFETYELIDAATVAHETSNYEVLVGGKGREIYFRQVRYRLSDLLGDEKNLLSFVLSDKFTGTLKDLAVTGASCVCSGSPSVKEGQLIGRVRVVIGDVTLYSGRARIVYAAYESSDDEPAAGQTTLGLHLVDDVVDIDRVMKLRSVAHASAHMGKALGTLAHNAISPEYRMCVSDYLFLLVQFRSLLARQERALEQAGPIARSEWETALLEEAWRRFSPTATELQERMEALTNPNYADPEFRKAHREYTLPVLTPYMAAAANYRRAWHKPLGYPGDYMLMAQFYDRGWHGPDLFSKLMYKSGDEQPMVKAVRSRKDHLRKQIESAVSRFSPADPSARCNIVCLGSGPAREVAEFAATYRGERRVRFVLVDQDDSALAYVSRLLPPLLVGTEGLVEVQYLHVAFKQLLRSRELFETIPRAHLIYSGGLFDYLDERPAKVLMGSLFDKLAPSGRLLVGNFAGPPRHAWAPSHILDWDLKYRTEQEMRALVSELPDTVDEVAVETEPSGLQFFVSVRKRAAVPGSRPVPEPVAATGE